MSVFSKLTCMAAVAALGAPAAGWAQDADGDGAPDAADAFPCDARLAAVSYYPSASASALLAFEDQWPGATDLDFNDVVVRVHYRIERDASGAATVVLATFDPVALGGDYDNGLGLQLPVSAAGATARRRVAGGAWQALPLEVDAQATVVVSSNLRELFGGAAGPVNAISGRPRIAGDRVELELTFAPAAPLGMGAAPFDVFIFRASRYAHQIHLPSYRGTAAMDTGLFNQDQDASTPTRSFVHLSGIPAALNLQTSTQYPLEGVAVSALFPAIVTFAASGGLSAPDFYTAPVSGQGHDVPALALPVDPAASTSCLGPRYAVFTTSGTFTVPAGVSSVRVAVVGGGGGGGGGGHKGCGSGGGGGGGGRVLTGTWAVTPGASLGVTVGGGGGGVSAGRGGAGGASTFGGLVSAAGGAGGEGGWYCGSENSGGGAGGSGGGAGGNGAYGKWGGDGGTGGTSGTSVTFVGYAPLPGGAGLGWSPLAGVVTLVSYAAGAGGHGHTGGANLYHGGGGGGGLLLAGAGPTGAMGTSAGSSGGYGGTGGRGYGGGGGGASGSSGAGGAGASGVVYVEW